MLIKKKGFTLIEILVAVILLGFIVASANLYGKYIGVIQTDVNQKAIISTARLGSGVEYMIQRILHTNNKPDIDKDGKGVTFEVIHGGSKRTARIYLDEEKKELLYDYNINDAKPAKVFLKDIANVNFAKELIYQSNDKKQTEERLSVEVQADHEPYPISIRTSIVGRNRPTPKGKIN